MKMWYKPGTHKRMTNSTLITNHKQHFHFRRGENSDSGRFSNMFKVTF